MGNAAFPAAAVVVLAVVTSPRRPVLACLTHLVEVADARALFVEPHGVARGFPKLLAGRSGEQRNSQSVCRLHGGASNAISNNVSAVHAHAHVRGIVIRDENRSCPCPHFRAFAPPLSLD